ncbi:retroviral-like aspartic protease family protein [Flavobacteriaceae bacterium]|jgi:predicted aspartyl protease|nr:retroviral-like aspartic protease family protein [Flavobacteriaceae bacterium]
MKKIILFFLISGLIFSCSTTKTTPKVDQNNSIKPTNLEMFLTKNNDYIKIPLSKMTSGHLHLNAMINGIEGSFILDTGAGATVIDPKRLKKFSMKTQESKSSGAGAGGQTSLQQSLDNSFKIGKLEMPKFLLYVMNLDHVNNAFNSMGLKEVDGVIGADILSSNKGIIDYTNLTLYLKK